ncbi:Fe-S cluster assembly protein SufD [Congregibacter brevis]|uniref:Fe-S cluster assembly protein SufD n=1 Tax=Congregibacter brevis TaxID=3081201 RepID=A0ABZ0IE27_9GAMM|nr:Fe-S cluster assembly protein SufD [Congregibacter sp. IMCC45268]
MSSFMQQPLAEAGRRVPHWLQSVQARGLSFWEGATMPTRRTENWKYTGLSVLRDDYQLADAGATLEVLPEQLAAGFGGSRLVFVDGVYQAELSNIENAEGVSVCRFEDASEAQATNIAEHLNGCLSVEDHLFAALNTATLRDGVYVEFSANTSTSAPVEFLWLVSATDAPTAINQRLLVVAQSGSKATIVEHFASLDGAQDSFCNGLTELFVAANAKLNHYRIHEESGNAIHIGGVHARLDRDAQLDSFHLALGSVLKRFDLIVNHAGPGAYASLNGVYLPRGDEHIDYHSIIEHAVPHCSSDEVFRGIIADRATAVFNGRIHIHPDAQKTRAELSNRNLLTSAEATINSKPELEIYADDVQCAHGTTVAQLDESAMHYLRTRGVSQDEAEVMLSFGFINELIEGLDLESLQSYLRPLLASRFARNSELSRHLL